SVLYTELVKTGIITLEKLIEIMSINPRKRFGLPASDNDFCVWDLSEKHIVNPDEFLSMGRSTPFDKREVMGKCLLTVKGGKIAFIDKSLVENL
ncbi:MAG: dihydroorotase, partial [Clostridia bacterium]|nr:dihydroorotase [Clostridia bacterium]